ncbi:vWA domain-containing protein [Halosimplex sp. TS25]|uniref:vWA domain-containing protein n=1 Tax=Halosimplex rarum TaxID=3396619 RepID=UPI0039E818BD
MARFGLDEVEPTEARVPNVMLLDNSGSMGFSTTAPDGSTYEKIELLNEGLELFKEEVENDYQTKKAVDLSLFTFGGTVDQVQEFTPIQQWTPPELQDPSGGTPMCNAIVEGTDHLQDYTEEVDDEALPRNRALMWVLTDGEPDMRRGSDDWDLAQEVIEEGTKDNHFLFYAVGIGDDANMDKLEDLISVAEDGNAMAFQLDKGQFKEFFRIVSETSKHQSKEATSDEDADDAVEGPE